MTQVLFLRTEIQAKLSIPPNVRDLAASPAKFASALAFIISELEKLCNDHKDDKTKMPRRLFTNAHTIDALATYYNKCKGVGNYGETQKQWRLRKKCKLVLLDFQL